MAELEYKVLKSRRKTLALEVNVYGVMVRAPYQATDKEIRDFVQKNLEWILKTQKKMEEKKAEFAEQEPLTIAEVRQLADQALKVIPERVRYYAPKIGVTYGKITIRNQRSKWGSCSSKGNLNFNCLLMLAPPEVLDSIVVHELCHRKEMNHSERFYQEVYRVFPDYDRCQRWLKENGPALMMRMLQMHE